MRNAYKKITADKDFSHFLETNHVKEISWPTLQTNGNTTTLLAKNENGGIVTIYYDGKEFAIKNGGQRHEYVRPLPFRRFCQEYQYDIKNGIALFLRKAHKSNPMFENDFEGVEQMDVEIIHQSDIYYWMFELAVVRVKFCHGMMKDSILVFWNLFEYRTWFVEKMVTTELN